MALPSVWGVTLPMPPGWRDLPVTSRDALYRLYMGRARFPEITSNAIRSMVGVLHGQDWQMDLPGMEYLFERATKDGLTLDTFSKRITIELLTTGRYSVMADAPNTERGGDPYLCGYPAESLINWDENDQSFYVFEEVVNVRDGFTWRTVLRTRVLELSEGTYRQSVYDDGALTSTIEPRLPNRGTMPFIPVAIGGAMDMDLKPDTPPLIGVARAAVSHYQLYADWRNILYISGQPTLFVYNAQELPDAVGAGVLVGLNAGQIDRDVKAEYVSASTDAVQPHVDGMDREQQSAVKSGAALFDNTPRAQESGEARRLRFSAETATIQSIANSSAAILEKAVRAAAMMKGLNPEGIIIRPPQNLLEGSLDGQAITALVTAWEKGAFGYETLYENLQRGRVASMERTPDEEQALIDQQAERGLSDELMM